MPVLNGAIEALLKRLPLRDSAYYGGNIYARLGRSTLDRQLRELCKVYLEGTPAQRAEMVLHFKDRDTWIFVAFIRRLAAQMTANNADEMLELSLAAACLENAQFDIRDLIVSLALLRHALERTGKRTDFDLPRHLNDVGRSVKAAVGNVRRMSKAELRRISQEFGAPYLPPHGPQGP